MSRFDTRQLIAEAENSFETRPWRGTDAPRIDLEPKQTGAIAYLLFFLWCSWQWFVFPEGRCMVQNKVVARSSIPASVEAGVAGLNWKEAHKKTLPRMMAMVDAGALERQPTDDTSSDRVKADKRSSETPSGMPTPVRRIPATLADFYAQDRTEYHGPPASFGSFKGAGTVAPDAFPLSNSATDESKVVAISHGLRKRSSADDESVGELKERPTAFAQIRSRSSLTRGTDAIHSQHRSNGIPKSPAARAAGKQQAEQGEMTSSDGRTTSVSGRRSESAADRHQLRLRGFAPPRASGSWLSVDGEDDDGDELRDDGSYYSRFRQWLAGSSSFFSVEASPAAVSPGARRASAADRRAPRETAAGPADSTASEATEEQEGMNPSDGAPPPSTAEADTPGAAIALPATTEQAAADTRLKQDIEERNVCYLHLIRARLQNFYLPHVLFLFAASSFLGFVALTNICKLRGRSTAMLNTIALLWFCFVAYAAIATVFSYYLPWQVYEPALNSRGLIPWLLFYCVALITLFQIVLPTLVLIALCGCLPCIPCCAPFMLLLFRRQILQGGAGSGGGGAWFGGMIPMSESRRARLRAQETLARCTSFKLLHEHIVARGEENCCCAICLQDCELAQEVSESPCGHLFHQDCLEKWAQFGGTNCPVCRRNLADPYPGAGGDAPLLNTEERGVTSVAGGPTPGVPLGSVVAGGAEE